MDKRKLRRLIAYMRKLARGKAVHDLQMHGFEYEVRAHPSDLRVLQIMAPVTADYDTGLRQRCKYSSTDITFGRTRLKSSQMQSKL